jgi:transcriptional regulator with XRE-family HTH domain
MTQCKYMTSLQLGIAHPLRAVYPLGVAHTFGGNLRRLRQARGLSQEAVAAALGHKRPSTVQSWEKNRRCPKPESIRVLAEALKCEPWELLEGVATPYDDLRSRPPSARKKAG